MDQRIEDAQKLFWEISRLLRENGSRRIVTRKFIEMARIHEDRAGDLLQRCDPDGWPDAYAAITAWGKAGNKSDAFRLIAEGRELSALFPYGKEDIESQLAELETWLVSLQVMPSLGDFARPIPPVPAAAA